MNFLIADTFSDSLARPTGDEQKAVKTTAFDAAESPRILDERVEVRPDAVNVATMHLANATSPSRDVAHGDTRLCR